MVAIIGAGTALALVGLIYGVVKLFSSLPVGLFELGMGIAVGGATMLLSVLIYNLARRLLPKLYPLISRLAKWTAGKLSDLLYKAKKEVGR